MQRHVQIHLVGRAGHRLGIKLHIVEIAQELHALFRALQFACVIRRRFHLAQFAADHFIAGFVVAADVDFVYINFAARIHMQHKIHHAGLRVGHRLHIHFTKGIAGAAHGRLNGLQAVDHAFALIPAAFFHGEQLFQILLRHFAGIALDAHFAPAVALALMHFYGDGLLGFFIVGLNIGVENAEIEIAVVLIKLTHPRHVLREFLLVKLIAFGEPSPHAAFAERHLIAQFAVGIMLVALKLDVGDFGAGAFVDFDVDGHAVARQTGHFGRDLHRLLAAADVFLLQAGHGLVERGLVKRLRLPQAERIEVLQNHAALQHFRAGDVDAADGGALHHSEQHLITRSFHPHIVEKAGGIKIFDDFFAARIGEGVAHFYRQVAEHGARLGALQAFYADILNGKVGQRQRREAQHHQSCGELFQFHKVFIQTIGLYR